MSSNSFIWVTEGGDFSTADWGCLHVVAVRLAARVSDEKRIRGVVCEMQHATRNAACDVTDNIQSAGDVMASLLL